MQHFATLTPRTFMARARRENRLKAIRYHRERAQAITEAVETTWDGQRWHPSPEQVARLKRHYRKLDELEGLR